jgi:HK97 gp10 family phage protein
VPEYVVWAQASWYGRRIITSVSAVSEDTLREVAEEAADIARDLVPVRSGYLQSTIGVTEVYRRGDIISIGVGASAYYARFVEEGTSRMAGQPFIRPAVEAAALGLPTRFRTRMRPEFMRALFAPARRRLVARGTA